MRELVPRTTRYCASLVMLAAVRAALADPALPWPGFEGDPARGFIDRRASVAKHLYMFGSPATWKTPIAWRYNDAGRPDSLGIDLATAGIADAAQKWMDVCRVSIVRGDDTTSLPQNMDGTSTSPGENVVGWGDLTLGVNGNGATSGITWDYEAADSTIIGFDMTFSSTFVNSTTTLARAAVHEWGHALGLAHSNIPNAVMSGPDSANNPGVPDTAYNTISDLTDDDKHGCLCLYGPSDALAGQGYLCGLPPVVTMDATPIGASSAPQPITLTNASPNASLTINSVSLGSAELARGDGCDNGTQLAAGESCSFNVVFTPKGNAGVRAASYVSIATSNGVGTYSFPVTATALVATSSGGGTPPPPPPAPPQALLAPTTLTFGASLVGTTSAPVSATLSNAGGGTLTITAITPQSDPADFAGGGTCAPGVALAAGTSCTLVYRFTPQSMGAHTGTVEVATDQGTLVLTLAGAGGSEVGGTNSVIEYYNATLNHYFMTASAAEIAVLDNGQIAGWARTGYVFQTYLTPQPGTSPVCRYYIPPAQGNSHFFSVLPSECNAIPSMFPTYVLEGSAVMYMFIPDASSGACPAGTVPVFRLWNGGPASNHRYTIDPAVRVTMIARGYISEGYGPDGVGMCAPQ
ncbi:MAG TPA: choice-of-anchor D domain-containing protein [Casimicrobiaceae bacterium]